MKYTQELAAKLEAELTAIEKLEEELLELKYPVDNAFMRSTLKLISTEALLWGVGSNFGCSGRELDIIPVLRNELLARDLTLLQIDEQAAHIYDVMADADEGDLPLV